MSSSSSEGRREVELFMLDRGLEASLAKLFTEADWKALRILH
jgi:hypothetical protein